MQIYQGVLKKRFFVNPQIHLHSEILCKSSKESSIKDHHYIVICFTVLTLSLEKSLLLKRWPQQQQQQVAMSCCPPVHEPLRQDPRTNQRMDPRTNQRADPRLDPRMDPRQDPRTEHQRLDPRTAPRTEGKQEALVEAYPGQFASLG